MEFAGLQNYRVVFADPRFHTSIINNFIWAAMHIVFACIYGFILAYMISRVKKGRTIFRNILFLPHVIALPVSAVIWALIYNPQFGILNLLLDLVGLGMLQRPWLGDPTITIYAISMSSAWQAYGYYVLLFIAGLQNVDAELYEASELDGAGRVKQFIHITVPSMRHVFTFVFSMSIINGLRGFATVWVMTQGGPGSSSFLMILYGFVLAFRENHFGRSMVSGVTLGVMILVLTLVFNSIRDRLGKED